MRLLRRLVETPLLPGKRGTAEEIQTRLFGVLGASAARSANQGISDNDGSTYPCSRLLDRASLHA